MAIFNSRELESSKTHFSNGLYKLGSASASLLYLSYPISMLALQTTIGYTACVMVDTWSNITYHNSVINNGNTRFAASIYSGFGYQYQQAPKYFSDDVAKVLNKAFEIYSPYCYIAAIACSILLNPQHAKGFLQNGVDLVKNTTAAACEISQGVYHLGKSLTTSETPEIIGEQQLEAVDYKLLGVEAA